MFADVLSEEKISAAFDEARVCFAQEPDDVYTPPVTLWAFLSQVISKGEMRSCAAAVARVAVLMVALGKEISDNTGAYCRTRAKLPEAVLERLACDMAAGCERAAPAEWLWLGHHVHLVYSKRTASTWRHTAWVTAPIEWNRVRSNAARSRTNCSPNRVTDRAPDCWPVRANVVGWAARWDRSRRIAHSLDKA